MYKSFPNEYLQKMQLDEKVNNSEQINEIKTLIKNELHVHVKFK